MLVYILYVALGLFQIAATISGIEYWLGLHWFFAGLMPYSLPGRL